MALTYDDGPASHAARHPRNHRGRAGKIIDGLRRRGFTLVSVSDLVGSPKAGETYFAQP